MIRHKSLWENNVMQVEGSSLRAALMGKPTQAETIENVHLISWFMTKRSFIKAYLTQIKRQKMKLRAR